MERKEKGDDVVDTQARFVRQVLAFGSRLSRRMPVGIWAAAEWTMQFYERRRFECVAPARTAPLLTMDWTVPDRQIATAVVLANPPLD